MYSNVIDLMKELRERINELGKRLKSIEELLSISKTVLNLNEVCILTGYSKSHIYKLTYSGKIPHYKQHKMLFFDRLEIEVWLKSFNNK
jgi:predicted DNA-binding transcriptional regulator AlpA